MISHIIRNIFTRVVFVLTTLSLASLSYTQELPVAAANTLEQVQLLVGTTGNGRLRTPDGDVVFKDEDILRYDLQQQTWSMYFDGSDVGIRGDVNAFSMLSDGSMLLSLDAPAQIADLGLIDDSDILHFQPDSTGVDTSGTLSIYFDGSDVGLTTANEDIHALSVLDNGNLLISTNGNNSVPGVNATDEDLLEFSATTLGAETAGTWALYFDGSNVDLTRSSEDIWALSAVGSNLHLATQGTFSADGIQGGRADVLLCAALLPSDQPNFCRYSIFTRGQDIGFGTRPIDSMEILIDSNNTDITSPTGVAAFAPAANEFDWHNSDVTVNYSWSDAGGISFDNCTTQTDITSEGAAVSYSAFCSDLTGNVSEITGSIAVDKQQPETNITSLPTVVDAGIHITFEGTDSLSGIDRFECSLNDDDFVPCTSPQQYENLDNGNYSVEVRSIDRAGNTDQTADSQSWVVDSSDLTAPIASPVLAPIANALDWHNTDVVVTFNWTDDDGLDTDNCTTSTAVVDEGASLQYIGTCDDINGNTGSSTGTVSIDRTAPDTAIFASPDAVSSSTAATFEFTGTDNLSGIGAYECQLDGNGYTPCTSPAIYQNLVSGSHVFEVKAIDIADNQQAIPAKFSWTIEEAVTDADAAAKASRFLQMAALAATEDDISAVINNGMENWLDNQIGLVEPGSRFDWLLDNGYKVGKNVIRGFDFAVWERLFTAKNVVRQRWTLALSEIFVVGIDGLTGPTGWQPFAGAAYLDMLEEKGLGNYRDLLEEVTLNVQMGEYLSLKGSKKRDGTGRAPDENYAREVLQLFSIGLYELNNDGTFTLDANGRPIETYDNDDIVALAKALTGWSNNFTTADVTAGPDHHRRRMIMREELHDTTEATFLGTTIAANTNGEQALKIALDAIAGHDNVGPFLAAQFIQRLVTSNPSPAYVQRVASVFNSDEFGVRGNLAAVLKAVLLDPEALDQSPVNDNQKGKLREPILRFIQWGRTFNLNDPTGAWIIFSTSSAQSQLGQSPLRSPSVFNFFRPDYIPPNSSLGDLNLTAPELQITNETTVAGFANFMHRKISTGFSRTVRPDYSAELQLANDPEALVSRLNLLLAANQLSPETVDLITSTVDSMASSNSTRLEQRVHAAILMVMLSPDYLVLR